MKHGPSQRWTCRDQYPCLILVEQLWPWWSIWSLCNQWRSGLRRDQRLFLDWRRDLHRMEFVGIGTCARSWRSRTGLDAFTDGLLVCSPSLNCTWEYFPRLLLAVGSFSIGSRHSVRWKMTILVLSRHCVIAVRTTGIHPNNLVFGTSGIRLSNLVFILVLLSPNCALASEQVSKTRSDAEKPHW